MYYVLYLSNWSSLLESKEIQDLSFIKSDALPIQPQSFLY